MEPRESPVSKPTIAAMMVLAAVAACAPRPDPRVEAAQDFQRTTWELIERDNAQTRKLNALRLRVLGRSRDQPFLGRELGSEPDYSEEIAREIDDEIRRIIEESHETAMRVLREHMDELKNLSEILIERETIDRDHFERLLAGESGEAVFGAPEPAEEPAPKAEGDKKRAPRPKPKPFPIPGQAMQPPPPEPS